MASRINLSFTNIIYSISLTVGIGMLIYGFYKNSIINESKNWPSVQGEVVSTEIKSRERTESYQSNVSRKFNSYKADIQYKYSVNNVEYVCNEFSIFHDFTDDIELQEAIVKEFSKGSIVEVFYDPDDYSYAILEHGGFSRVIGIFISAGIFGLIGLLLFKKSD